MLGAKHRSFLTSVRLAGCRAVNRWSRRLRIALNAITSCRGGITIPIFGWIALSRMPLLRRGDFIALPDHRAFLRRCCSCFYYVMFFPAPERTVPACAAVCGCVLGACSTSPGDDILTDWPMYLLVLFLVASLLASSLVDASRTP